MGGISLEDLLIHSSSKITYYGKHKPNIGRNVCMLCLNTQKHVHTCIHVRTMYDKVQQTTKSRKQNKKNKNKRERDRRARSGKTCTKETTDYLQRVYHARIQIQNNYTCTALYIHTYTHTQGMLGKARAHEGNKLTSTRNGVKSIHKMHCEFQNMFVCMYL